MKLGVHLQVRLWLLTNFKRKYGVDPPTMMDGGTLLSLFTKDRTIFRPFRRA